LATIETFYHASGSSPPAAGHTPLPPELVEDLARLLADALVADIRQYPNLSDLQPKRESTVESPWGLDRTRTSRHGDVSRGPARGAPVARPFRAPTPQRTS
jgi:hypothetical protein